MERSIKIFKSFEEQELYLLKYFVDLTPSERLQALSKIRQGNFPLQQSEKKVTVRKHFVHEY